VLHRALRAGLMAAGAVLACSLGCQTQPRHEAPGALPSGLKADVTPRLNAATHFAYAHLLERQGNLEQAVEQYRQALDETPNFVSGRNSLGIALNKLGRHAEAIAEFQKAIHDAPNSALLHNNLGFSLYLEGRFEEAAGELKQAIALKPDFPRAHMNYGVVLAALSQYDQALTEFCLATSKAEAYYNLGVVYGEAGEFAGAARALETALRLNPNFDAAREQLRVVAHRAAEAEAAPAATVAEADPAAAEPASDAVSSAPPPDSSATLIANETTEEMPVSPVATDPFAQWQAEIGALIDRFVASALQNLTATCDQIVSESLRYRGPAQPESPPLR
jgi:tetratricopeptide (TPR) repeat protein